MPLSGIKQQNENPALVAAKTITIKSTGLSGKWSCD